MKEALAVWARSNALPAVVAVLGLLALALFGWYFRYDVTQDRDSRAIVLIHDRLTGNVSLRTIETLVVSTMETKMLYTPQALQQRREKRIQALMKQGHDREYAEATALLEEDD